jgi:hypothetical protein
MRPRYGTAKERQGTPRNAKESKGDRGAPFPDWQNLTLVRAKKMANFSLLRLGANVMPNPFERSWHQIRAPVPSSAGARRMESALSTDLLKT